MRAAKNHELLATFLLATSDRMSEGDSLSKLRKLRSPLVRCA
jgi:hypothetical protein